MNTLYDFNSVEERIETYKSVAPDLVKSEKFIEYLKDIGYFESPASLNGHGCYEGGLFEHSLNVAHIFKESVDMYRVPWARESSWFIMAMFHDLCVLQNYDKETKKLVKEEKMDAREYGMQSLKFLEGYIDLKEEERLGILWHRGSYEGLEGWDEYIKVIKRYPTVYTLFSCNMISTYIQKQ